MPLVPPLVNRRAALPGSLVRSKDPPVGSPVLAPPEICVEVDAQVGAPEDAAVGGRNHDGVSAGRDAGDVQAVQSAAAIDGGPACAAVAGTEQTYPTAAHAEAAEAARPGNERLAGGIGRIEFQGSDGERLLGVGHPRPGRVRGHGVARHPDSAVDRAHVDDVGVWQDAGRRREWLPRRHDWRCSLPGPACSGPDHEASTAMVGGWPGYRWQAGREAAHLRESSVRCHTGAPPTLRFRGRKFAPSKSLSVIIFYVFHPLSCGGTKRIFPADCRRLDSL